MALKRTVQSPNLNSTKARLAPMESGFPNLNRADEVKPASWFILTSSDFVVAFWPPLGPETCRPPLHFPL